MDIIWGLSAALGWGIADFQATRIARASGPIHSLMWTQGAGLLPLLILFWLRGDAAVVQAHLWLTVLPIALLHFCVAITLYRAFQIGTLSIVSPIASSYIVITALLSYLDGERAPALTLAGAGVLLTGVIAVTAFPLEKETLTTRRGIFHALASAIGFGALFWQLPTFTPHLGTILPLLVLRATTALCCFGLLQAKREKKLAPSRTLWPLIAMAAMADAWAWWSFTTGTRQEPGVLANTTLVTALSSLFGGVTVLLACLFLKERLSPYQWAGVATVLLGILLVSL